MEKSEREDIYTYINNGKFGKADKIADKMIEYDDGSDYRGYYVKAMLYEYNLNRDAAMDYYKEAAGRNASPECINDMRNVDINIMRNWLQKAGAVIENIKIEYYDVDYRGMVVCQKTKKAQSLIQIPFSCVLSLEECKKTGYSKILIERNMPFESPHTPLAIALLERKVAESDPFQYAIKCYPELFDNLPMNWTCADADAGNSTSGMLAELEGSYALVKIATKLHNLKTEYERIKTVIPEFHFSFEEFKWARSVIITRVYSIERDVGCDRTIKDTILAPFADMANHAIPPNTHWTFNKETQMFVVSATQNLTKNAVLYESYGEKCNYRYFVNYGFTVERNKAEEVAICLNPVGNHIIQNKSYETDTNSLLFLMRSDEIFQIGYNKNDAFKKMIQAAERKCQEIMRPAGKSVSAFDINGFLIETLKLTLRRFPTTLEDDLEIVKKYDLGFNMKNCLIQRIGEKKLLNYYIGYFNALNTALLMPNEKERRRFVKKIDDKLARFIV